MHSLQLCREKIGGGVAQGPPTVAPPCVAGSAGADVAWRGAGGLYTRGGGAYGMRLANSVVSSLLCKC